MQAFCVAAGTKTLSRQASWVLQRNWKQRRYIAAHTRGRMRTEMKTELETAGASQVIELDSKSSSRTLYPPINPWSTGYLQVSDVHRVYYEISGNPHGLPVCFVHGGPGGATVPMHRQYFDPEVYKIVLYDQRGCGKSTPTACLEENTTWDLIADMERIREAAEVDQWVLFGGSWGSTLTLAYAQKHPDRVKAMILRGIFAMREKEIKWLYERNGAAMLYPEAFEKYVEGLPEELRNSECLMDAYYTILSQNEHSEERRTAAYEWSNWEHILSKFPRPGAEQVKDTESSDEELLAFARIESHYFVNKGWLKEDGFLLKEEQMKRIRNIKTCIIQGKWDLVCPRTSAYELSKMFDPEDVETILVDFAGHSTFEPGMEEELVKASDRFGRLFGRKEGEATP